MKFPLLLLALLSLLPFACSGSRGEKPGKLLVSAAANMNLALTDIAERFEKETGIEIDLNFGSTGQLTRQIEQGAPTGLFLAADRESIELLEKEGRLVADTQAVYALGSLALWTHKDSAFPIEKIEDLASPNVSRIAIANPSVAPYGRAAREALTAAGLWERIERKLVFSENISQALTFAETKNVDVAFVALSLALETDGRWTLVPAYLYSPIEQAMAVVKGTEHEAAARTLASFIAGPEGQEALKRFGYAIPGEKAD